jgi:acyl carrier protein
MTESDALRDLLIEFFQLPQTTTPADLTQLSIARWDSLAMVQLITELQSTFGVEFELGEIEHLTSYAEIRAALLNKNIAL